MIRQETRLTVREVYLKLFQPRNSKQATIAIDRLSSLENVKVVVGRRVTSGWKRIEGRKEDGRGEEFLKDVEGPLEEKLEE